MHPLRLILLLAGLVSAFGQAQTPCQRISLPKTTITIFNTADLSSKTTSEGEEVELRVDREVRTADCVLIPQGALARGHIRGATQSKSFGRAGKLDTEVDQIQAVRPAGDITARGHTGAEIIADVVLLAQGLGVLAAPLLIPLKGGEAKILAGTAFEIELPAGSVLDGTPVELPATSDAHLIVFRSPRDLEGKILCFPKGIECFGNGRYAEFTLAPGRYKIPGFGTLELAPGDYVYLRLLVGPRPKTLMQTGGGIFEFFLPLLTPLPPPDADKMARTQIKGPLT